MAGRWLRGPDQLHSLFEDEGSFGLQVAQLGRQGYLDGQNSFVLAFYCSRVSLLFMQILEYNGSKTLQDYLDAD